MNEATAATGGGIPIAHATVTSAVAWVKERKPKGERARRMDVEVGGREVRAIAEADTPAAQREKSAWSARERVMGIREAGRMSAAAARTRSAIVGTDVKSRRGITRKRQSAMVAAARVNERHADR